jgi:signal transduction histidine kinase
LVRTARDELRPLAEQRQIDVQIAIADPARDLVIDPSRLKQVVVNYLSNALKFSHDGGLVIVRACEDGADFVRLEVEDHGIGIKADDMGRLFVEFQQLDAGTSKKYAGTGLGLSLTKRIVETQGDRSVFAVSTGLVVHSSLVSHARPTFRARSWTRRRTTRIPTR